MKQQNTCGYNYIPTDSSAIVGLFVVNVNLWPYTNPSPVKYQVTMIQITLGELNLCSCSCKKKLI